MRWTEDDHEDPRWRFSCLRRSAHTVRSDGIPGICNGPHGGGGGGGHGFSGGHASSGGHFGGSRFAARAPSFRAGFSGGVVRNGGYGIGRPASVGRTVAGGYGRSGVGFAGGRGGAYAAGRRVRRQGRRVRRQGRRAWRALWTLGWRLLARRRTGRRSFGVPVLRGSCPYCPRSARPTGGTRYPITTTTMSITPMTRRPAVTL